ncbi:hypothetical protein [Burkholderia cepacia]|uniref:hypothetical protein n=1 Tax=Burkholderia cepacia TaxID=292 RepID=UPI0012D43775|nr:hypothetical protein [Burkholderia cepacia]
MNSNKLLRLLCAVVGSLHLHWAIAGEISLYDESRFVTFSDGGRLYGYYSAHNELFYCRFLFYTKKSVRVLGGGFPIETFDLDYRDQRYKYARIDPASSIRGFLSKKSKTITINTERPRAGCQSAAGFFPSDGGLPYTEVGRIYGVGIGVLNNRSSIYRNFDLIDRIGYLFPGDVVVVIKRKGEYSYIRYVNPDMLIEDDDKRHIKTGWIRSADLVNPFLSTSKP